MPILRTTVQLKFPTGSTRGTNTFHIRTVDNTPSAAIVNAAMDALKTYYQAVSARIWLTGWSATWDGSWITTEETPQAGLAGAGWTVLGTGAGSAGPAGVGLVVGWRSTLPTRRGRGRTFHAPMKVSEFQSDGTIVEDTMTAIRAAAAGLITSSTGATGWAFGVYSPTDNVLRDITSAKVNDKVAWLSSRRDL